MEHIKYEALGTVFEYSVGNAATKVGASIQKSSLYNDKTRFCSLTEACELMVWKIIKKSGIDVSLWAN